MKKPLNYEESVNKLEEIIRQLEEGELPLEQSIQLFTEGMDLVKTCNQYLEQAEEKIKILVGDKLEDFSPSQE
ncbi:MAG: exodeoxyribonuclease VII small subunit [Clostridia bacterium]|nr:exodeoxyribonuclease VII small subunit [Clostridia bacterium]